MTETMGSKTASCISHYKLARGYYEDNDLVEARNEAIIVLGYLVDIGEVIFNTYPRDVTTMAKLLGVQLKRIEVEMGTILNFCSAIENDAPTPPPVEVQEEARN